MTAAPLNLKQYFVANFSVKANQPPEGTDLTIEGSATSTVQSNVQRHSQNKNDWKVILNIACSPNDKALCSYFVELELVGFFETPPGMDELTAADIVAVNGPSALYGSARELIMMVTGRGPFPPICLNSISFAENAPSRKRDAAEKAQLEPKKA